MLCNCLTDCQSNLDGVVNEAIAFQLHLTARDVKARDELLVGACRRMRKYRLMELRLDRMEVDVLDQKHRPLAKGRH